MSPDPEKGHDIVEPVAAASNNESTTENKTTPQVPGSHEETAKTILAKQILLTRLMAD